MKTTHPVIQPGSAGGWRVLLKRRVIPVAIAPLLTAGVLALSVAYKDGSDMTQVSIQKELGRAVNRLRFEKSPYLLQHADNPVDWYPWGPEAFELAREEDRPVFLSIGYSTCHWCHVMAHESFEDDEVARLMNDAFVCVKVDREERPDVDQVYMTVCQMMTGGGGWPLTIIMTPDRKPFFAATYIPRRTVFNRIGMLELIPRVQSLWSSRRGELLQTADEVATTLRQASLVGSGEALDASTLELAARQLVHRFDGRCGGFGEAPKFPTPHHLTFLLRQWKRTGEPAALEMVVKTLEAMRRGGIYDHLGFGFHRYATDRQWLVPHFEKMLYDQALLALAYLEGYQASGEVSFAEVVREVFTYVLRDVTSPEGAFYAAEDADSDGREGRFYLWTESEIREVLGDELGEFAVAAFGVRREGNFAEEASGERTGENILHLPRPVGELAESLGLSETEFRKRLEDVRRQLFFHRSRRVHPHKDDKILADWNGLMIAALARGAQVLGQNDCAKAAARAADFVLARMRDSDGRLLHRHRDGQAALPAYVDDYAFMIWGLLDLYEATFEPRWLQVAIELNDDLIEHFWDEKEGGLFFTADDGEALLVRPKEIYDGAVPSGNSVAMLNCLRLARLTGRTELEQRAVEIGRAFASNVKQLPSAHTQLMVALDFGVGPTSEVVVAGDPNDEDTRAMLHTLHRTFSPNKVVLLHPTDTSDPSILRLAPWIKDRTPLDGQATAYVCTNHTCNMPTTDVDKMLALLE